MMLDRGVAAWVGKVVLTLLVVGVVIGIVTGIAGRVFFPGAEESGLLYAVSGGITGVAAVLVLRLFSRKGWL